MRLLLSTAIFFVLTSCASVDRYGYIGKWEQHGLTWVNTESRLKITFPNPAWQVCAKPPCEFLPEGTWKTPSEESRKGMYLEAVRPAPLAMFDMMIDENPGNLILGLEDLMMREEVALPLTCPQCKDFTWEILGGKGRQMARGRLRIGEEGKPTLVSVGVVVKEPGRLVWFDLTIPERFEETVSEFMQIVDSYATD
jgi:hypothetical protein